MFKKEEIQFYDACPRNKHFTPSWQIERMGLRQFFIRIFGEWKWKSVGLVVGGAEIAELLKMTILFFTRNK